MNDQQQMVSQIIQALQEVTNPNQQLLNKAEDYLLVQNINNKDFYASLFLLIANSQIEDKIRIAGSIIYKRNITKNWKKFDQQIKDFLMENICGLIMNISSLRCLNILNECIYKMFLLVNICQDYPQFEPQLLNLMQQNQNDSDKLYSLLSIYSKLAQSREHSTSKEREIFAQSEHQFMQFFTQLTQPLINAPANDLTINFTKNLCKIFMKIHKYEFTNFIRNSQNCQQWMLFFKQLLEKKELQYDKSKKWVMKILILFCRACYSENLKKDEEFLQQWKANYFDGFYKTILIMINEYNSTDIDNKLFFQVSRCFYYFFKDKDITAQYKNDVLQLYEHKLIFYALLTEDDHDQFISDPIEYFRKNDIYSYTDTLRDGVSNITLSMAANGFVQEICQILFNKLKESQSNVNTESYLFLLQKLCEIIPKQDNGDVLMKVIFEQYVIPSMDNQMGELRMRCCLLINHYSMNIMDQKLTNQLVEKICQRLEDKEMPVRSYAAVALDKLLLQPQVADFIRPHVQTILNIFINLINECDNETLIDSIGGIFQTFNKEITPYVLELLQKIVELIQKMFDKFNNELQTEKPNEDSEFSMISAFKAIKELILAPYEQNQIPQIIQILDPLVKQCIKENDMEIKEEMFYILNILIFKSDQIDEYLWQFLEFIFKMIDSNYQISPQNNFQEVFTLNIDFGLEEMETVIICIFRNFQNKKMDELIQRNYIQQIIKSIKSLQDVQQSYSQEEDKLIPKLYESYLLYDIASLQIDNNNWLQLMQVSLQEDFQLYQRNKQINEQGLEVRNLTFVNLFWHNFGLAMFSNPQQTLNTLNQIQPNFNLIQTWTKEQQDLLTFRIRKASFLGLCALLQNSDQFNFVKPFEKDLYTFMMTELLVLSQLEQFNEDENDDFDLVFKMYDEPDTEQKIQLDSLENIDKYLCQQESFHSLETQQLLNFDQDYVKDRIESLSHVDIFKQVLTQKNITQNDMQEILKTLSQELQKKVLQVLGLQKQLIQI